MRWNGRTKRLMSDVFVIGVDREWSLDDWSDNFKSLRCPKWKRKLKNIVGSPDTKRWSIFNDLITSKFWTNSCFSHGRPSRRTRTAFWRPLSKIWSKELGEKGCWTSPEKLFDLEWWGKLRLCKVGDFQSKTSISGIFSSLSTWAIAWISRISSPPVSSALSNFSNIFSKSSSISTQFHKSGSSLPRTRELKFIRIWRVIQRSIWNGWKSSAKTKLVRASRACRTLWRWRCRRWRTCRRTRAERPWS